MACSSPDHKNFSHDDTLAPSRGFMSMRGKKHSMTTPSIQPNPTEGVRRRRLSTRYAELLDRIIELLDSTDPFGDKLRQIVSAHRDEVGRKLNDQPGTARYLQRVMIFRLYAILLLDRYIQRLRTKLDHGERWTKEERRATKSLERAIDSFTFAIDQLSPHLGRPTFQDHRLPALLWHNLYNLTVADAERDAHDIITLLSASMPV